MFEYIIAHRRSVAVLFMLYKIMCNPKHPLYGALLIPYVPVHVTRGDLVAHRYTYEPPRCRTSLYRTTFIHLSVSRGTILLTLYSMVLFGTICCDLRVLRAGPMPFYWSLLLAPFRLLLFSFFFLFIGWYCVAGTLD